ncbi:MAG: hypothetical protein HUK20_10080 [Fibrobacter sp.]|nr:hypothetical protein [Fibrobacter sp.]
MKKMSTIMILGIVSFFAACDDSTSGFGTGLYSCYEEDYHYCEEGSSSMISQYYQGEKGDGCASVNRTPKLECQMKDGATRFFYEGAIQNKCPNF